VTVTEVIISY